jgi:integrase
VGRKPTAQAAIDTPSKRQRLKPRRNPYWHGISGGRGGASLGYRKPVNGAGSWIGKIVVSGSRIEEKIGVADDVGAGETALPFPMAVAATIEWAKRVASTVDLDQPAEPMTVRRAVEDYGKARTEKAAATGRNAGGRLRKHVLSDEKFAEIRLSKLTAGNILDWRKKLPVRQTGDEASAETIAPATLNRTLNDLRAALNAAAEQHRRSLPAHLAAEIKVGTRAQSAPTIARKQLLTDDEVRRAIEAAFEVDEDFGRWVVLAAATGARHAQLRKVTVGDLQPENARIMVPGASKGRSARERARVAVPLTQGVIERLQPAANGRTPDEPLLQRWAYKRAGRLKWKKSHRVGWGPAYEVTELWQQVAKAAELPAGTIAYALRHSSIVRALRNGIPVRIVAALHDTSSTMIEQHYAAFIIDATEEIARRSSLSI